MLIAKAPLFIWLMFVGLTSLPGRALKSEYSKVSPPGGNYSRLFAFYGVHENSLEGAVTGHFTRKDKLETVWLVPPQINADETGCITQSKLAKQGDCIARLNFSDPTVPAIMVENCIGGTPVNLGDLDNDGLDEIGLLPEWFTSCWRSYRVYTYKKGQWIPAVTPFPTHCNQWEQNLPPIIKDPAKKGNVIITYSAFEGTDIVFKTKSVVIK